MVTIKLTKTQAKNLLEFLNRVPLNPNSNNGIVEAEEYLVLFNIITDAIEKGDRNDGKSSKKNSD